MKKTPIWVHGCDGKVGRVLQEALQDHAAYSYAGGSSSTHPVTPASLAAAPALIDFSSAAGNAALLGVVEQTETPLWVVVGTTGLSASQLDAWASEGALRHRVLYAPNCSLGILVLAKALQEAKVLGALGFDIEIREVHQRNKKDAPSGTSLYLANQVTQAPSSIHSCRGGEGLGEHTVDFLGSGERLTLSHQTFSRGVYAQGALRLMTWLREQPVGFYTLDQVKLTEKGLR